MVGWRGQASFRRWRGGANQVGALTRKVSDKSHSTEWRKSPRATAVKNSEGENDQQDLPAHIGSWGQDQIQKVGSYNIRTALSANHLVPGPQRWGVLQSGRSHPLVSARRTSPGGRPRPGPGPKPETVLGPGFPESRKGVGTGAEGALGIGSGSGQGGRGGEESAVHVKSSGGAGLSPSSSSSPFSSLLFPTFLLSSPPLSLLLHLLPLLLRLQLLWGAAHLSKTGEAAQIPVRDPGRAQGAGCRAQVAAPSRVASGRVR